ncbi:MAG: hypothetical protein KKF48_00385 [Nanoarchaeota archaeon]|nr:hypothetical protein [Nanoarchaeota archaeon]MBU1027482.1 hypothetical protein [Nanoarchaeota archaeon]
MSLEKGISQPLSRKNALKELGKQLAFFLIVFPLGGLVTIPLVNYDPINRLFPFSEGKSYEQWNKEIKNSYRERKFNEILSYDLDSNGVIDSSEIRQVIYRNTTSAD